MRRAATAFLLAALLAPLAQAARRGAPDIVEDALAYAVSDRDKSIRILEGAIADGPPPKDLDKITVHAGEQRRLAQDHDEAHRWFAEVATRTGRGPEAEAARLGMILIEASKGVDSRVRAVLESVPERDALDTQNADRYMLLALEAARTGDADRVGSHTRKALAYAKEDPEVLARVSATLQKVAVVQRADEPQTPAMPGRRAPLELAREALAERRPDEARKQAEKALAEATPGSPEHRRAEYLLRRIDGAPVSRGTIAVLLPLAGKYQGIGTSVRQALEFGYEAEGGRRTLEFVDSGATPETAVRALETAVLERGAIAVVGPLLTDETEAVVAAAEALEVPLVSLSQSLEDTDELEWTLQAMVTIRDQVHALVDAVMADGLTRFAVIAPDSPYGNRATAEFKAAVEEKDGQVVVVQLFPDDATDFMPYARALGRKEGSRERELYELRVDARRAGGDASKVVLPPTLDFDAMFLPDAAKRVPLVCAALAYEEFPMGDFQPHKTSPVIPMLGLNGWNNDFLVSSGGPYVRMSYFPDSFAPPLSTDDGAARWTPEAKVLSFVEGYRAALGRTPKPLEAVVVDAGRLLAAAASTEADTREEFLAALLAARPSVTVTGVKGFDEASHRLTRDLLILTVVKDGILPRAAVPPKPEY